MAVKLRLKRIGKTHRPFYRICAIDSRRARGGAYIESIGHYDPLIEDNQKKISVDRERARYWLSVGAQPSETVASFLRALDVPGAVRLKKRPKRRPRKGSKERPGTARKRKGKKETTAGSS